MTLREFLSRLRGYIHVMVYHNGYIIGECNGDKRLHEEYMDYMVDDFLIRPQTIVIWLEGEHNEG